MEFNDMVLPCSSHCSSDAVDLRIDIRLSMCGKYRAIWFRLEFLTTALILRFILAQNSWGWRGLSQWTNVHRWVQNGKPTQ